ncbi:MAG: MATE family efflux transporter [Oleispira sp.]
MPPSSQTASHQVPPILTEPVAPLFIKMALPIIFGLMINGLFNFVDAIFISRAVGTNAIGGVSAAFPIQMIMISISAMLGSGMASIISRYLGANKDDEASMVFSASLVLAALVGLILSIIIVSFRFEIFELLQLPTVLIPYAVDYLTPIAAIGLISFCHGTMSEGLRAQGLNVQVFKLMASMALLNIALDALFLFVFDWGVPGAAWATALSITFAFFYAIYLLKTGSHRVSFTFNHFRFIPKVHQEAITLGIPVFLSYTGFAMMLLMVNVALVKVGGNQAELLISAHGILNRTFMLIFLPVLGMMIAFQTFAGFNYGAQRYERVTQVLKVALVISSAYALVWSVIMIFGSQYLFQLFTQDQALIKAAADIASIVFIAFITVGIGMICPALFQALGFAKPAILLNSLHSYILLLPTLWICSSMYGVDGIWWSFPVIDVVSAIVIAAYTGYFLKKNNLQ